VTTTLGDTLHLEQTLTWCTLKTNILCFTYYNIDNSITTSAISWAHSKWLVHAAKSIRLFVTLVV